MLLDRSGSMNSIRDDVVGGFNAFITDQQAQPGECRLTLVQFDSNGPKGMAYEYTHLAQPIAAVRAMTKADYTPRGGTPLYDAIGRALQETEIRAQGKSGEVQLFVIFSDGEDTTSSTFSKPQIFEMIETKQAKGWVVTFLGANQDAYGAAAGFGIAKGSTQAFMADAGGTRAVMSSVSSNTAGMRSAVAHGATGQSVSDAGFYSFAGKAGETYMQTGKSPNLADPSAPVVQYEPPLSDEDDTGS